MTNMGRLLLGRDAFALSGRVRQTPTSHCGMSARLRTVLRSRGRLVLFDDVADRSALARVGLCTLRGQDRKSEVISKTRAAARTKPILRLSETASFVAQRSGCMDAFADPDSVTFNPLAVLPDIDFRGNAGDLRGIQD